MSKFTLAQKAYLAGVGLDEADPEILQTLGNDQGSDGADKFKDIDSWDGVYRDLDQCGVDTGYQPGSEGAKAWEAKHPGQKVVDWMNRDENDPIYQPDNESSALDAEDDGDFIGRYKQAIDSINQQAMQKYGLKEPPFLYDATDNLNAEIDPSGKIFNEFSPKVAQLYSEAEKQYQASNGNSLPFYEYTRQMGVQK